MDNSIEVFKLGLQVLLFIRHDVLKRALNLTSSLNVIIIHPLFIHDSSHIHLSSHAQAVGYL